MSERNEPKNVNVKIPYSDYRDLEKLVKAGEFLSVSDAVRTAIRNLIDEHKDVIRKAVEHPEKKAVLEAEQR